MKVLSAFICHTVALFHVFLTNRTFVFSSSSGGGRGSEDQRFFLRSSSGSGSGQQQQQDEEQQRQEQRDLITGGTKVFDDAYYPFFAFMKLGNPTGCGGTLIHEDIVLTSAQCVVVFEDRGIHIGGDHTAYGTNAASEFHEDELLIVHPDYTGNNNYYKNDIMLIKLETSSKLDPVVLDFDNNDDSTAAPLLTVIGHGDTRKNGALSADLLYVTGLVESNFDACDAIYQAEAEQANDVLDQELHICVEDPDNFGKDSCQADAGGPLLLASSKKQIGIVSFGIGCGQTGKPSVYTRLSHYKEWIHENICEHSNNPPSTCTTTANQEGDVKLSAEEMSVVVKWANEIIELIKKLQNAMMSFSLAPNTLM